MTSKQPKEANCTVESKLANWNNDKLLDVAKNGYRVLLTCARKGMVIFVPNGDTTHEDDTRKPVFYDRVYEYLVHSGATDLAGRAN